MSPGADDPAGTGLAGRWLKCSGERPLPSPGLQGRVGLSPPTRWCGVQGARLLQAAREWGPLLPGYRRPNHLALRFQLILIKDESVPGEKFSDTRTICEVSWRPAPSRPGPFPEPDPKYAAGAFNLGMADVRGRVLVGPADPDLPTFNTNGTPPTTCL